MVAFLDRLYTARRRTEERIVVLGGEGDSTSQPSPSDTATTNGIQLALRDVLTNPSWLSYFMEFMDRRNRSLLIQFWLTVESFKNPLESVESDSDDQLEAIHDTISSSNIKEDICLINDLYFSSTPLPVALAAISTKHVENIKAFAHMDGDHTLEVERRVRRSVLQAQRQVERDMEGDFEDLQKSELWFRIVKDIDNGTTASDELSGAVSGRKAASATKTRLLKHQAQSGAVASFAKHDSTVSPASELSSSYGLPPAARRQSISAPVAPSLPRSNSSHIDILMDSNPDGATEQSRAPLFDDTNDHRQSAEEAMRMDAIQAALTDIIAYDQQQSITASQRETPHVSRRLPSLTGSASKTSSGLFDNLEDDNERFEDEADEETGQKDVSFQAAAPGDLHLSYEISRLGAKIAKLQTQVTTLGTLIRKAELTGDTQELKLLERSKASVDRELRALDFQKTQYEQQEAANRLISERTKILIVSTTLGEEDSKSVVRYLIQIQQMGIDESLSSGWIVARRYNEFLNLHNKLKDKYGTVKTLDFPGKRLVTALSGSFVDTRRTALEKYLQVSKSSDPEIS